MLLKLSKIRFRRRSSRKSTESKENVSNKPTNEDAEFGFNETRRSTRSVNRKSDISSPPSSRGDPRPSVGDNMNNIGKSNSPVSISASSSQVRRKENENSRLARSVSSSSRTYNSSTLPSGTNPRRQNSMPPKRQLGNGNLTRHVTSPPRRDYMFDVKTPDSRCFAPPNNKVQRHNSMLKLESWVHSQKLKQHSNRNLNANQQTAIACDTASVLSSASSPNRSFYQHPSGHRSLRFATSRRRYKPGLYSDYMDSSEVASSIMSVPPMYRSQIASLPPPSSSQETGNRLGNRQRIANSKSVGYLSPDRVKSSHSSKSEHNLFHHFSRVDPSYYPRTTRSPNSINSPRRVYDDVFSPQSNSHHNSKHFKYDSALAYRNHSFTAAISPLAQQPTYRLKEIDMKVKEVSPIAERALNTNLKNLNINEDDIEKKLRRLNELGEALQKLSSEMQSLQNDKRRLEVSLVKAKSSYTTTVGSEFELEENLSKVKSQLTRSTKKLKEMAQENEAFEREIKKLKAKLLEELNKKMESKSNQRQLEWELGRVQFIMEGVNKNKAGLVDKIQNADDVKGETVISPPTSARDGSFAESTVRSPREVKRISFERRTPGGILRARGSSSNTTSQDGKFFTLPGHGVSRATSVDSLTAAQIARFTRTYSGRSANLHRTKSAAERLLSGSNGNLASSQDPNEIKKMQRELSMNRRRAITGEFPRRHTTTPTTSPRVFSQHDTHMQVGIDVQMEIKHHRMPKVLQRAKRDMQRAEAERRPVRRDYEVGFDIDRFEAEAEGFPRSDVTDDVSSPRRHASVKEIDVEPEELYVDVNLTHQLLAPDKVDIPDRLLKYDDDELTPAQVSQRRRKMLAIEKLLVKSGQPGSRPTVHLTAALAAEAGSVARAVAFQAQQNREFRPSIV